MVSVNSTSDSLAASSAPNSSRMGTAGERVYRLATLIAGVIVAALGACVVIGWLTDRMEWVRLGSDGPVMRFNSALLVVAIGLALVTLAIQQFRLMHLIGAVLCVMAAVTALQYPLGRNLGIDELIFRNLHSEGQLAGARMSINGAISFMLLGLAFVVMRSPACLGWQFFVTALLASAALSVSIVAIFGHATGLAGAFGWGGTYGMATPTAISIAVGAVVLLVWSARYQLQLGMLVSKWFPLIVGNAAVIGTFVLWHALVFQDGERIHHEVHAQFKDLFGDLSYAFHHHEGVVTRMAKRWNAGDGTPQATWRNDAKNYLEALKGFEGLAWVNAKLEAQWIEETDEHQIAQKVESDRSLRETIAEARRQQMALAIYIRATDPAPHIDVWICQPVLKSGVDDGCLLAVFDLRYLLPEILRRTPMADKSSRFEITKMYSTKRIRFRKMVRRKSAQLV